MKPSRRVLLHEATYEEANSEWPVLRCKGCGRNFLWIFEGHQKADAPRYHTKGCKRGHKAKPMSTSVAWTPINVSESRCPACGKIAAPTLEAAKMEKRRMEKAVGRTNPVRYYQCESGYFHWTRWDADVKGRV